MENETFTLKRNSEQYEKYINGKIDEYNSNGKINVVMSCDAFFPIMDGVVSVMDNLAKRLLAYCNVLVVAPEYKGLVYEREYPVIGVKSGYSKKLNYEVALPNFDAKLPRL